ncbi:hypothetical protein [Streptosporangium sp. NPDC002524]|uniref:hypothetical protein n=1 Tax=Streptosporangium sp. NPDC002524 TaxID=3154537 RepID=UPI003318C09A
MSAPLGHTWGVALTIEPISPEMMRTFAQNQYFNLPGDLESMPDYDQGGLVLDILDRFCTRCRRSYDDVMFDPCAADTTQGEHLRGGMKDREARIKAKPEQMPAAVLARQAAARREREVPALMQASRLSGLS